MKLPTHVEAVFICRRLSMTDYRRTAQVSSILPLSACYSCIAASPLSACCICLVASEVRPERRRDMPRPVSLLLHPGRVPRQAVLYVELRSHHSGYPTSHHSGHGQLFCSVHNCVHNNQKLQTQSSNQSIAIDQVPSMVSEPPCIKDYLDS
ncbi:hypothetical protein M9H77_01962 [Catharanthus roseus]|uniref:Uncharacterized protein n=1 Tax=Catharanthus roseus TaxID=4058 RepID=A0ACC0C710_CATRO|nr:hypothetical protein M9H77_01962 [Catharanthus roseus]